MMLELLSDVDVANGSHFGWQDASVELQDTVVQSQSVCEDLLQLFLHCQNLLLQLIYQNFPFSGSTVINGFSGILIIFLVRGRIMACCKAYYFSNKMNQEANCGQNYNEYFSRPEVLEEMRENLASLIQQESFERDTIILRLKDTILPLQVQQDPQQFETKWQRVQELLLSTQEQLLQRSTNLTSVANLAIRMIDYITEQSASYYHSIEHYQLEIDRLQNTIDELTNRNTMIQSDVEIFREQLEAARNELDVITEDREQIGERREDNVIEGRIEDLESELERMRAQITFYKSSVFSRTALQDANTMIHTKSLLALNQKNGKRGVSKDIEDISVSEQVEKNRELELENERLKNEIDGYRKSMLFYRRQGNKMENSDVLCPEAQEGGSPKNKQLLRVRTSSKNFIQNSSCGSGFGFSEFFNLFKAKREERLQKLMKQPQSQHLSQSKLFNQPSQQSLQVQPKEEDSELPEKPRHLSSQWSRESLSLFHQQTTQIPQLIFLTQQSQQNPDQPYKTDFFDTKPTNISQNRQTQSSSKDTYNPNTIKITLNKSYESVGINTSRPTPTPKSNFLQAITNNSFVHTLKGFIISNRLNRSRKSANSGTSTILI